MDREHHEVRGLLPPHHGDQGLVSSTGEKVNLGPKLGFQKCSCVPRLSVY